MCAVGEVRVRGDTFPSPYVLAEGPSSATGIGSGGEGGGGRMSIPSLGPGCSCEDNVSSRLRFEMPVRWGSCEGISETIVQQILG